jgi:hypothetical protein
MKKDNLIKFKGGVGASLGIIDIETYTCAFRDNISYYNQLHLPLMIIGSNYFLIALCICEICIHKALFSDATFQNDILLYSDDSRFVIAYQFIKDANRLYL